MKSQNKTLCFTVLVDKMISILSYIFAEHAGELRVIALRRNEFSYKIISA